MKRIRFLFDCSFITPDNKLKGIPMYAIRLVEALPVDILVDCALLVHSSMVSLFKDTNQSFQLISVFQLKNKTNNKFIKHINYFLYEAQIYSIKYECILIMDEHRKCTLFKTRNRKTCIIHDLKSINGPDARKTFRFYDKLIKSSNDVIAISQYTKGAIIKNYGTDENKIHVVYNSVSLPSQSVKPKKFDETGNYILYVNTLLPYKNILTLIKAFEKTWERYNLRLVVVGQSTDYWESEIMAYVKAILS